MSDLDKAGKAAATAGKALALTMGRDPTEEEVRVAHYLVVRGMLVKNRDGTPGETWKEVKKRCAGQLHIVKR